MRMAHNAGMNIGRLREGRPLPGPPPLGEGTGRLPAGRGLGKPGFPVCSPQTVVRIAHNAAMNMGRLREGRPLPGPPPLGEGTGRLPAGRGLGKPGFPICSPQSQPCRSHSFIRFPFVGPFPPVSQEAHSRAGETRCRAAPSPTLPAGGLVPGRGQGRGAAAPLRPNPPVGGLCSPQIQIFAMIPLQEDWRGRSPLDAFPMQRGQKNPVSPLCRRRRGIRRLVRR